MTSAENIRDSQALVATAKTLRATSHALCDASHRIIVSADEARRGRCPIGARDGAAGRIARLILGRSLCTACIAHKAATVGARVDDVLIRIGHTVRTSMTFGACEVCRRETVVHRID